MKVLVAFASKHGSTKGISEFIGERLRHAGLEVDVLEVDQVQDLGTYDAFVLGSALYMFHWMKEARQFASRNRSILASRPVWLFSSGPVGKETKNAKGQDLLDPTVSGPRELEELKGELHANDHKVFFGAFEGDKLGFFYRQLLKSETMRKAMQDGDFRDWKEIEAWSNGIARSLQATI